MDKSGLLITRLFELYNNNASTEQLRVTAQLLLSELENEQQKDEFYQSVSVFFPASRRINSANGHEENNVEILDAPDEEPVKVVEEVKHIEEPVKNIEPEIKKPEPVVVETIVENKTPLNGNGDYNFFDPVTEIPTLALKQQELNETIAAQQQSLNDKLKTSSNKKEVAHNISDAPIRDLRKAIGINDQYLFINELFRGDQVMYDRSIKTINGFNIYGEAELWIKRELKLKLSWNEKSEAVHLFDQLVKRRFA